MKDLLAHPILDGVLPHLLSIAGFIFALFLIARLMSEKRQPGNTVAWLLGIILIPYLGVPLYLLFGGRKLRRLMAKKRRVMAVPPGPGATPAACAHLPVAQAVTASGGYPPVAGNEVTLLTTGEAAYRALESGIREARHTIHITTFILGRDDTGRRIVKLLTQRAREGIRVRLLLDAVGCMFLSRDFFASIKQAGGEVQWFMPVLPFTSRGSANLRNHRKIAVFDHTTAIVGGHNIAREYMGPTPLRKRWSDFGARIKGPAAAMLNDVAIADWCFASGQHPETLRAEIPAESFSRPAGTGELQVVASGPDVSGDPLYEGLVAMIQAAEKSIWIITPYFIPDEVLLRSLVVKARAGCAVTLIVPAKSNHPVTDFARRYYLRELHAAGVCIRLFGPGMMHSKATIVDDRIALFGSANFDLRSLFVNFEIGVIAHTAADVQAIKQWAQGLFDAAREPKPARPRRFRALGGIAEDLSRLLAPLL
jgi:cardiolipin synthase